MQAFCDWDEVFKCFDCELPGNTNDIIAYKQIELFKFLDFVVPTSNESCWMKLIVQLAPYSKHQLEKAKRTNIAKYEAMLCFNTILSLQRITIERALHARQSFLDFDGRYKLQTCHCVASYFSVC